MYNDIRPLYQCESMFIDYLRYQEKNCTDRNKDWFPYILENYERYLHWSIVFLDNRIVAFSAIQSHNFAEDTVRILSRTFFDQSIRLWGKYDFWVETPVAPMARDQLKWLADKNQYSRALITMEPNHSRRYFERIIGKINLRASAEFEMLDNRIQTYPNQTEDLFQNAAQMSLS